MVSITKGGNIPGQINNFSKKTLSHSYHFRFMFLYSKTSKELFFIERIVGLWNPY
jgi:hypothetical protein